MNAAAVSNQKSVPLIPVDADLLPNKTRVDVYRTLVAIALKEGLDPVPVDTKAVERLTLFLQPVLSAKIAVKAAEHKLSFQEAFAGLTAAGAEWLKKSRLEMQGIAADIRPPFPDARPDQVKFFQGIQAGLQANMVVLAEASTGVGKGRALCAAAIMAAEQGKTPVIIAAPTLKVLGQLWKEMEWLRAEGGMGKNLTCGFFPGTTEFVNKEKLLAFLENHDQDPDVEKWARNEGAMLETDSPLKTAMLSMGIEPRWLMDDLRALAINMPPEDFTLRSANASKETSDVSLLVKEVRDRACTTSIIFCTHAMLAISHMVRWTLLPEPAVLIIDEAHQFEQNVANVHSNSVSMFSLARRLGLQSESPAAAVKAIRKLWSLLQSVEAPNDQLNLHASHDALPAEAIKQCMSDAIAALKSKKHDAVDQIRTDRQALADALAVMTGASTDRAYVLFSPDRRFPSIQSGKSDLGLILGSLWKTAAGGSVLASATIYTQDRYGDYKSDYIADVLSLPGTRTSTPPPVIAKWVTEVPVLHLPSKDKCKTLARPGQAIRKTDPLAEKQWIGHVAENLLQVVNKAQGGTLVLVSSYWQAEHLHEGLAHMGVPKERIISQQRDRKLAVSENKFRLLHGEGVRPIWIALGAAWTGLDIRDKESENDTLLTDLVIACCPVGMNRTNTMNARIGARKMQPIIKEALMMLKQGLGRLMRDGKQTGRHLWFLDGRIWTEWNGMKNFQQSVEAMLRNYPNREIF